GDGDPVEENIGGAEGGPLGVVVSAESATRLLGLVQQSEGLGAVLVLRGSCCSSQQQCAVDRQGVRRRFGGVVVDAFGHAGSEFGGRAVVAVLHQSVSDNAGAGPDGGGVLAALGGLHTAVGGKPGQSAFLRLEQHAGRHVVRLGLEDVGGLEVVAGEGGRGGGEPVQQGGKLLGHRAVVACLVADLG